MNSMKPWLSLLIAISLLLSMARPGRAASTQPQADLEIYTYRLDESTSALTLWTAPPSRRVFKDDAVPSATGSGVKVYAARNETEPFVVAARPASSGPVVIGAPDFGAGITVELYQVKYVQIDQATDNLGRTGPYPDPLWPLDDGASVTLTAGENTAFWFSLTVPEAAPAGDYSANVSIGGVSVPVTLHVFDFAVPADLHVKSQMNYSHQSIMSKYGVSGTGEAYWRYVDAIKQYFIDHRLTPKGPLWPGGLTGGGSFAEPFIEYDCGTHTFSDPHGIWGFEDLAARYLDGTGLLDGTFTARFNGGAGFPAWMMASFAHNDPSQDQRPATFCGQTRSSSDWLQNPTSAYNTAWFDYLAAIESYLTNLGYLDEGYYYFANEPQDRADYDAVAWYSRHAHAAAPNLKLMVSEEPKPEIYDQPGAHIDIWLPVLNQYDPAVSHARARDHGEETWVYFLHGTRPPYFNPITLDHPGIEGKLTGWFLWRYRVRGIAYYAVADWSRNPWTEPMAYGQNGNTFLLYPPSEDNSAIAYGANGHRFVPSIRLEMLRDGLEDYEYLYVLAGGQPQVDVTNAADAQAAKIISGLTSYTRDDDFIYNLRRLIGLKNGGEIAEIPDISPPASHPRAEGPPGNYYINFQDPAGEPSADPLVVDGHTYMKIGWNEYEADTSLGYGWYGDMAHVMYGYASSAPNPLQASILYDDWGRQKTFEFDLPNGDYDVTVSVGWEGRSDHYFHNYIEIEGTVFINDEKTAPYIVRTKRITVRDRKLTMAMGIFDEYTMLNYLEIEAAPPTPAFHADATSGDAPLTVQFTDASTNGPTAWAWDFDDDGTIDATAQHPTHTYTEAGVYDVYLRVTGAGGSDELVREGYITVANAAVRDLRVTHALTGGGRLTTTLQWTPLPGAVTTTVRYHEARITEANWPQAMLITDTLPGQQGTLTTSAPYAGGAHYFALQSQTAAGTWSPLSNVAFWPVVRLYLPVIIRQ